MQQSHCAEELIPTMSSSLRFADSRTPPKIEEQSVTQKQDEVDKTNLVTIDPGGDLLLRIEDKALKAVVFYRVSSSVLRNVSLYFNTLLDPQKFMEGTGFHDRLKRLRQQYSNISSAPVIALPVVKLSDAGQIPTKQSNKDTITHFLDILHNVTSSSVIPKSLPNHIALLAAVADRFDAVKSVQAHVERQGWTQLPKDGKESAKLAYVSITRQLELLWRQRIYAGVVFCVPKWVMYYSSLLILAGSEKWNAVAATNPSADYTAIWWNLPWDMEGGSSIEPAYLARSDTKPIYRRAVLPP